jgi:hypothetical protein
MTAAKAQPNSTETTNDMSQAASTWWKLRNDYVAAGEEVAKAKTSLINDKPQPPEVLSRPLAIWPRKGHLERPLAGLWTRNELLQFVDGKVKIEAWFAGEGPGSELVDVPESGRQLAMQALDVLIAYEEGFSGAAQNLADAEAVRETCLDRLVDQTVMIADLPADGEVTLKTEMLAAIVKDVATSFIVIH